MRHLLVFFLAGVVLYGFSSCTKNNEEVKKERAIVVAIPQHPYTFNPITAKNTIAKEITSLVYPGLYYLEFNPKTRSAEYKPQLASWSEAFGSYVMVRIRPGAKWTDDIPVSAKDILYSYQLYANEQLGTIWRPMLKGLKSDESGAIDLSAAIDIDDDSTVTFHFNDEASVNYAVFTVPIIPRHQMDALPAAQLKSQIPVKAPTLAGPFLVAGLNDQEIVLSSNILSVIPQPARLDKIAFRVFRDKASKVEAMKVGQIDIATDLTLSDIASIKEARDDIDVVAFPPLRYHVIGWNNIDHDVYASTQGEKIKSNRMFGNANVRRALTLAINREEIITSVAGKDVVRAFGPVSPMFAGEYHDTLHQPPFDPAEAKMILMKESWQDLTRSGTLEKYNQPFSFKLKVSSDDVQGINIAEMVKKQLKDVGIDMTIVPVDPKQFPAMLKNKDFDAFIGAVDVPQTLDLKRYWGLNLQESDLNVLSFRDKRVTEIVDSVSIISDPQKRIALWREFQDIVQVKQPCTFLYWESQYAVKSKRLNGITFSPEGFFSHAWDWSVTE